MPNADSGTTIAHDPARNSAHNPARPFARGTARGAEPVAIRIPAELRDQLEAERDRIEPPDSDLKPRSLDRWAARVFAEGLKWMASVEPMKDPLA